MKGNVLTVDAEVLEGAIDVEFRKEVERRDLEWEMLEFLNGLFRFLLELSKYNIVP
jgi:hypothetical protein